jgi:hypothetical protein
MSIDEVLYVLTSEPQKGPFSAKTHYRNPRIPAGGVIANPGFRYPEHVGDLFQS